MAGRILASATLRRTRQQANADASTAPRSTHAADRAARPHLGAAVTPAIMWGIAHAQGIRLPTKDYWAFRDLITVGRRPRSFEAYLELFKWTELIQSSPIAVERSVYEVIGGAYRKNNVTGLELRFNPMKRNRGGEQDLDHIIAAAVRGMDRAILEYPQVRAGLIFCLEPIVPARPQRDHRLESDQLANPRRGWHRHRRFIAWIGFRFADYAEIFTECRRAGLGLTVHAGETGGAEEVREALEALEPDRIGHGVRSAEDSRVLAMLRERGTVLEVCPRSNLNTRVLRGIGEVAPWSAPSSTTTSGSPSAPMAPRCCGPTCATSSTC